MHILLCNERFLFRFGADRVMILLGRGLRDRGHKISVMACRLDEPVVRDFASQVVRVPEPQGRYFYLNEDTKEWLEAEWSPIFAQDPPEAVVIGGWPFFAAVPFFRRVCPEKVIFLDFGAVPLEGYDGGTLVTQQKLRELRKAHLPAASEIVAISEFIRRTQSEPDSAGLVTTHAILLGADHLDLPLWTKETIAGASPRLAAVRKVEGLRAQGLKLLLNLGRWEPGCYKNSEAALAVIRQIRTAIPNAVLLVLANGEIESPPELADAVKTIGFPDDREMRDIMERVDLGLSVSLWEGFNLPLAEMQWLGRPALAFDIGAHPEVVVHPWYLCQGADEMAAKAIELLSNRGLDPGVADRALRAFRSSFRWQRFVSEFARILENASVAPTTVVIDVTNSTRDPANSGVIRVTRRLCRELQSFCDCWFAAWDDQSGAYVLPTHSEHEQLSQFNGPVLSDVRRLSASPTARQFLHEMLPVSQKGRTWLLLTETVPEDRLRRIVASARAIGLRCAAVFHDAIPVLRPDLCSDDIRLDHPGYMTQLAECDVVIPNSEYSARCLEAFWRDRGVTGCVAPNPLPGEFSGMPRCTTLGRHEGEIRILCVCTIEPRKNHRRLIAACEMLEQKHPDLDWHLTLVGNRYAGAFDLAEWVQHAAERNPRIRWLGIVDDQTLRKQYEEATFTVYPSIIEGFGLPILESLWHGRPCVCSEEGVMAELAAGGGCLTTNVHDEAQLCDSIARLATDRELWEKLSLEAIRRPIKTWSEYARQLSSILAARSHPQRAATATTPGRREFAVETVSPSPHETVDPAGHCWEQLLFRGCIQKQRQMHDSEKLGMAAVLARIRPACSIEIGTYHGGSLSLISQYSSAVISIDLDPEVPARMPFLENVHFLVGRSFEVLPKLLEQLTAAEIPIEFVLIDGDHSAEGVKRDVACLLEYVPLKPLFVLLHDSFNPECRQGMLEAGWSRSRYCHYIELDFVPGRPIEHDGPSKGELWGGLAMAFFSPSVRTGELVVRRSANWMFEMLKRAAR